LPGKTVSLTFVIRRGGRTVSYFLAWASVSLGFRTLGHEIYEFRTPRAENRLTVICKALQPKARSNPVTEKRRSPSGRREGCSIPSPRRWDMSKRILVFSIALLFALALASVPVWACSCSGIVEGNETPCTGTGGCNGFYIPQYCGFGCTYGDCYSTGYGQCCDRSYKTWNINTGGCNPREDCGECGQIRVHGSSKATRLAQVPPGRPGAMSARPRRDASFDAANAFENDPFAEEILFVPDRCRHTYGALYPEDRVRLRNSVARSQPARVPPPGGGL